jgi:superfamily II DNA or RNA helicase
MAGLIAGRVRVVFGTTEAEEAIDIPPLTHVFVTYPVHTNMRKMDQIVGRCARPHGSKKYGIVYYFWDSKMFPIYEESKSKFLKKFKKVADTISVD